MIENKKGVESWGVRAWEWAGKVRRYVGESSRVWAWKVLGYGRGKCVACSRGGGELEVWLGMFEGMWALKVRGFLWVCKLGSFLGRDNE